MEINIELPESIHCSAILNFGLSIPFNVVLDFVLNLV